MSTVREKPFTPETLSEFLEVPVRTLEDWRGRDYGPAWFRAGNRIRYTPTAVRAWMEGQSSSAGRSSWRAAEPSSPVSWGLFR